MEPVRTKRYVVLAMVFTLAVVFTLGCVPSPSDNTCPAPKTSAKSPAKSAPAEKSAEKPEAEGATPQVEGAEANKKEAAKTEATKAETLKTTNNKAADAVAAKPSQVDSAVDAAADEGDDDGFAEPETAEETARRLGPPLVEKPEQLQRFDSVNSIWLDNPGGRLIMVGEVCQRQAPLEMLVCLWHTKEHEAVLTARVPANAAHAGLLALGAEAGSPVQFMPKYIPASGTVVDIEVIWKDEAGKIQKKRAQEWVRNYRNKKPMELDWVFAGSGFWTDEKTGQKHYQAESGDFICVSNFSTAMLDLPIKSTHQNDGLVFEAFTENIPPLGTPVTIVLKPRLEKDAKPQSEKDGK